MVKISIQGARGSFHDIVARSYFPDETEIIESPTYQQVFEDIKKGTAQYGVVAIENSSYGSFLDNYDLIPLLPPRYTCTSYITLLLSPALILKASPKFTATRLPWRRAIIFWTSILKSSASRPMTPRALFE